MIVRNYEFHCVVMFLMYLCQGIVTGTLTIFPLMVLQMHPEWPVGQQATMGLPVYAFSFKFLWAPLLDRCYVRWLSRRGLHRRVQWVFGMQVLLGLGYLWVLLNGAEGYLLTVTRDSGAFMTLWYVLTLLAIGCATQDVAVDAWAVEGIPEESLAVVGSLQLTGSVCGVSLCNIFVQANSSLPGVFTVANFCIASSAYCGLMAVAAVWLALRSRPLRETAGYADYSCAASRTTSVRASLVHDASEAAGRQVALVDEVRRGDEGGEKEQEGQKQEEQSLLQRFGNALRELFNARGLREIVHICLSRGWPTSLVHLMSSRLVSLQVVTAAALSRYRLYNAGLQIVFMLVCVTPITSRYHAAAILRRVTCVEFISAVALTGAFLWLLPPASEGQGAGGAGGRERRTDRLFGPCLFFPSLLVLMVAGSLASVSGMTLNSSMARRFPQQLGTVLTLLNAIGNLGHHVPHTIGLYLADVVIRFSTAMVGTSTGYATEAHLVEEGSAGVGGAAPTREGIAWWWFRLDIIVCAVVMFTIGFIMRRKYLVPSAKLLCAYQSTELDPLQAEKP